jgi:hypothetical protein
MDDWSAVRLVLAILEGFTQIAGLDAPHSGGVPALRLPARLGTS